MEAGKPPDLMSLLGEYEATGRDPTADGIPTELQVIPKLAHPGFSPALLCHVPCIP